MKIGKLVPSRRDVNRFVYNEGRKGEGACVVRRPSTGASHAACPSAFQHARDSALAPDPPDSWDHMFLCNGFCCSPPSHCFFGRVHATAHLFHWLLGYHLLAVGAKQYLQYANYLWTINDQYDIKVHISLGPLRSRNLR